MTDQLDLIARSEHGPADVPSDDQRYAIEKADAVELLSRYDGSIHLLCTDPAYESLEKHRVRPNGEPRGNTTRLSEASGNKWFPTFPDKRWQEFFHYAYRALVDNAHAYVMSAADLDQICVIVAAARAQGFHFWKSIPWDKGRAGMGYHWNASHEVILFFEKGHRNLNYPGWRDWFDMDALEGYQDGNCVLDVIAQDQLLTPHALWGDLAPVDRRQLLRVADSIMNYDKATPSHITEPGLRRDGLYPTEKPVPLFERLIANSTHPGEVVVDPFVGSGSCGEAAVTRGRRFIGGDIVDDAIARSRLRCEHAVINFKANKVPRIRAFKR